MRIDNSALVAYQDCPLKYYERYVREFRQGTGELGIELIASNADREFGTQFHSLLQHRHLTADAATNVGAVRDASETGDAEGESADECSAVWELYLAQYPVEPLQFISAERTDVVPLEGSEHELAVKLDGVVRHTDGTIGFYDAKTERPNSQYNLPEAWAARTQATLYLYALTKLYPAEQVSRGVVDVITRGNSKRAPVFRRMDDITRTPEQMRETVRNAIRTCDEIERHRRDGWWPRSENHCKDGWKRCDFYPIHVSPGLVALELYKPAERYLEEPK